MDLSRQRLYKDMLGRISHISFNDTTAQNTLWASTTDRGPCLGYRIATDNIISSTLWREEIMTQLAKHMPHVRHRPAAATQHAQCKLHHWAFAPRTQGLQFSTLHSQAQSAICTARTLEG